MTHSFAADHAIPQTGSSPKPSPEPSVEHSAAGTALGAFGMVAVVGVFALLLHTLAQHSPRTGPGYAGWPQDAVDTPPLGAVRWFLGDMTEHCSTSPISQRSDYSGAPRSRGGLADEVRNGRARLAMGRAFGLGSWYPRP